MATGADESTEILGEARRILAAGDDHALAPPATLGDLAALLPTFCATVCWKKPPARVAVPGIACWKNRRTGSPTPWPNDDAGELVEIAQNDRGLELRFPAIPSWELREEMKRHGHCRWDGRRRRWCRPSPVAPLGAADPDAEDWGYEEWPD